MLADSENNFAGTNESLTYFRCAIHLQLCFAIQSFPQLVLCISDVKCGKKYSPRSPINKRPKFWDEVDCNRDRPALIQPCTGQI